MPLMPMPPIPTKWIRASCRAHAPRSCQLPTAIGDPRRRIRPRERTRRRAMRAQPLGIRPRSVIAAASVRR